MASWHEPQTTQDESPWTFALLILAVPVLFLGGYFVLNFLLLKLAEVFA